MFSSKKNKKKYILIIILFLVFLLSIWLIVRLFPSTAEYLPIFPTRPKSIAKTKKIYDLGSNHHCQISPFTQNIDSGEYAIFQVSLQPSHDDSPYELELGGLPQDVTVEMPIKRGRGDDQIYFKVFRSLEENIGSFTMTLAYHEYQLGKFKWLTNYCLFNVILQ